ncbi:hypothetical protein M6D93_01640 [Jatrophihabitans telluris]|uniref:Uncharacterized protein n=1 Tax=Jatrophihabitans telluris TaxID=2038343 RepID=A0ABY4QYY1_9ACTN|nr:hypothetical protein [Jatrophihabitans telluris]UQX88718.1 hypothetical protein M6D93_01640 [Jatrophihabitans telluris]
MLVVGLAGGEGDDWLRIGVGGCGSSESGVEHGLVQRPADAFGVVLADIDAVKDGLVQPAAGVRAGVEVGGLNVHDEAERLVELGPQNRQLVVEDLQAAVKRLHPAADALLLPFHERKRHSVGVVRLQQLELLVFQLVALQLDRAPFVAAAGIDPGKLRQQVVPELSDLTGRERDAAVEVLDEAFDRGDR